MYTAVAFLVLHKEWLIDSLTLGLDHHLWPEALSLQDQRTQLVFRADHLSIQRFQEHFPNKEFQTDKDPSAQDLLHLEQQLSLRSSPLLQDSEQLLLGLDQQGNPCFLQD